MLDAYVHQTPMDSISGKNLILVLISLNFEVLSKLNVIYFFTQFSCDNPSMSDIRAVLSAFRFAVKTIMANNLASNITVLPERTFKNGSVYELQIDGSSLMDMKENAFEGTTSSLQTLSIHNGKLTSVPRAIGKISSLKRLSLQSNKIHDIYAYAFFSQSKLSYLNLKDNKLETMAENAFLGKV